MHHRIPPKIYPDPLDGSDSPTPRLLQKWADARRILQLRENLLDLDAIVDDARNNLAAVLAQLEAAVQARDAAAERLGEAIRAAAPES